MVARDTQINCAARYPRTPVRRLPGQRNMDDRAGHTAIFAAEGSARQHLWRAAIVAAVALLAAWMIALALGVLGGFGSLPGLPSSHSSHDNEASSSTTHSRKAAPEAPLRVQRTASDT